MKLHQLKLVTLAAVAMLLSLITEAHAWGCVAVSVDTESDSSKWSDMTYGYSFHYYDQMSAEQQALYECAIRTAKERTCKIIFCESSI